MEALGRWIRRVLVGVLIGGGEGLTEEQELTRQGGPPTEQEERKRKEKEKQPEPDTTRTPSPPDAR
jgi:hypothetical protein